MLNLQGTLLDLSIPKIMGIINLNDESFYSQSRVLDEDQLIQRVNEFILQGVDIVDIGAQSTRPRAKLITEETEIERVTSATRSIRSHHSTLPISVDTFRSTVAQKAIENGANIINDISGFSFDPALLEVLAVHCCPYVLMHIQGDLSSMHAKYSYEHITKELIIYFAQKIEQLQKHGITDVIIDPGFGFSKSIEDNYTLLQQLELLQMLERPVLVGVSRKRMIYQTLGISPEEAMNGTSVLNTLALSKGASILRVHDVKEANEVRKLWLSTTTN